MTPANELDPSGAGGSASQGGSGSSAAPSSPGGAADLDLDAIEAHARIHGDLSPCSEQWVEAAAVCPRPPPQASPPIGQENDR